MNGKSTPIVERLRKAIRQAERKGITRYRIAKISGVNEGTLARLVNEPGPTQTPRIDTVEKLADALGYKLFLRKK